MGWLGSVAGDIFSSKTKGVTGGGAEGTDVWGGVNTSSGAAESSSPELGGGPEVNYTRPIGKAEMKENAPSEVNTTMPSRPTYAMMQEALKPQDNWMDTAKQIRGYTPGGGSRSVNLPGVTPVQGQTPPQTGQSP